MAQQVRLLAFAPDGVPPCGRLLVRTGRVALLECTADELASAPLSAVIWAPADPVPSTVPELETGEHDFVVAAALTTVRTRRLRDGESWDSPGAQPP